MGRTTIYLVLGVSVIVTMLIMSLNSNAYQGLDSTVDYYDKTTARLIANSGIEIYLEKLRRNKGLTGSFPSNKLLNGTYDINISGPDSALQVRSIAHFSGVTHTSIAAARRRPMDIPGVKSALYLSAETIDLHLNGNVDINGNDHNINGTPGPGIALPGMGVDSPGDSTYVVNDLSKRISKAITGAGAAPSVRDVNDKTDWLKVTQDYIFSADIVLPTGTYSSGLTFGTVAEPKITYCNGSVDFTSASGAGIMIVNGDLKLSGNFTFYGIIIVYGTSTIRTQTIGNNSIYGATIVVGDDVSIDSQGNAEFYYSSQAIQLAKANLKSSRFEILNWWE